MLQRISLQWFNARSGVRIQVRHRDECEHWTINGKEYSASTPWCVLKWGKPTA
jgi:hypothetical protein